MYEHIAHFPTRTEAQARAALHSHILCWFQPRLDPRKNIAGYTTMPPARRVAPGDAPRQRPPDQQVPRLAAQQHDDPYHSFQAGHVNAEMIRPNVGNFDDEGWGRYDVGLMRIAGLARSIQTKLYMHNCTPKYCLQNRTLALQIHVQM